MSAGRQHRAPRSAELAEALGLSGVGEPRFRAYRFLLVVTNPGGVTGAADLAVRVVAAIDNNGVDGLWPIKAVLWQLKARPPATWRPFAVELHVLDAVFGGRGVPPVELVFAQVRRALVHAGFEAAMRRLSAADFEHARLNALAAYQ